MKKKTGKIILTALLVLIAVLLITGYFVLRNLFTLDPDDNTVTGPDVSVTEDEEEPVEQLQELSGDETLSSVLKSWANLTTDRNLMHSADVENYLLVGVDVSGQNSDVMMLLSVNKATNKIYLSSVMRDSYTYLDAPGGETFQKMNAAYSFGGINLLIKTFQDNFKIRIDHYATVNFSTFETIIDIMGGINMDVEAYEAREIDHIIATSYSTAYDPCPYGENTLLKGIYALTFCRIRHCYNDADVHRTLNQRKFISALIEKSKTVSLSKSGSIITTLLKYVKTDMSSDEIMAVAANAIKDKWYNYEIVSSCFPDEYDRLDYSGNAWVWIVDYPNAAQKMQQLIYGTTNISLKEDRISAIDIMRNAKRTGDAHP